MLPSASSETIIHDITFTDYTYSSDLEINGRASFLKLYYINRVLLYFTDETSWFYLSSTNKITAGFYSFPSVKTCSHLWAPDGSKAGPSLFWPPASSRVCSSYRPTGTFKEHLEAKWCGSADWQEHNSPAVPQQHSEHLEWSETWRGASKHLPSVWNRSRWGRERNLSSFSL